MFRLFRQLLEPDPTLRAACERLAAAIEENSAATRKKEPPAPAPQRFKPRVVQ